MKTSQILQDEINKLYELMDAYSDVKHLVNLGYDFYMKTYGIIEELEEELEERLTDES